MGEIVGEAIVMSPFEQPILAWARPPPSDARTTPD